MAYKLIEATDEWMCRPRFSLPRGKHFFPSEASVRWTDAHGLSRCSGACLRQVYYRLTGTGDPAPTSPYSEWIFALGKAVEEILVEQYKQMGIWVANNIKFYDPIYNISGELDIVLREPETGKLFGAECKSFYGFQATRDIVGNAKTEGKPKTSQMLQTLIYVDLCGKLGIIDYFKMIYYARDSAGRREFDITLVEDKGIKRPAVDGKIDYRFTMQDVYDRYRELAGYLERQELPPRDYERAWDAAKVETMHDLGEVSKTAYADWQKSPKKNPVGDWQCRYCAYANTCYKEAV